MYQSEIKAGYGGKDIYIFCEAGCFFVRTGMKRICELMDL